MLRQSRIEEKLKNTIQVDEIYIENESHNHSGNRIETHFKLFLVSADFIGKSRLERQRLVNGLLKEEFDTGLHALTLRLLSPEERAQSGPEDFISPACRGGGR